jgi:hypothetical protein
VSKTFCPEKELLPKWSCRVLQLQDRRPTRVVSGADDHQSSVLTFGLCKNSLRYCILIKVRKALGSRHGTMKQAPANAECPMGPASCRNLGDTINNPSKERTDFMLCIGQENAQHYPALESFSERPGVHGIGIDAPLNTKRNVSELLTFPRPLENTIDNSTFPRFVRPSVAPTHYFLFYMYYSETTGQSD